MEFKLLAFLAIFLVANEASRVISLSSIPETYWNSELPNTPIPQSIKQILDLGKENQGISLMMRVKLPEINDEEDSTLYFMEQDILPGNTMNMHLRKTTNEATFVPRAAGEPDPDRPRTAGEPDPDRPRTAGEPDPDRPRTAGEPDPDKPRAASEPDPDKPRTAGEPDLDRPRAAGEPDPDKPEANIIAKTLQRCEELMIKGNKRQSCLWSLESMIDFVTAHLGHDVQAISTDMKQVETQVAQNYTVEYGVRKVKGSKFVACHKLNYPYAMYYCHAFEVDEGYVVRVPLKGSNGAKVVGIGVCHIRPKDWEMLYMVRVPARMAVVKSGKVPLCHFLAGDSIVWTNKRAVLM